MVCDIAIPTLWPYFGLVNHHLPRLVSPAPILFRFHCNTVGIVHHFWGRAVTGLGAILDQRWVESFQLVDAAGLGDYRSWLG